MNLFERVLSAPEIEAAFADEAIIRSMLRFEVSLARAQAEIGLVPIASAQTIARVAQGLSFDPAVVAREGAHAGSLAIAFVKLLRTQVANVDTRAADFVHFGTTSQDVLDTALALCTQDAMTRIEHVLRGAIAAACALARQHRQTPILARTLQQAAGVTTFGYKAAQWALALDQGRQRINNTAKTALAVSLGGAVGNLAAYGGQGPALRAELAKALDLYDPGATWHTHRQNWIALATDTALLCGTLSKIAQDIALMTQSEVAEVSEPSAEGRGGSSAMPHKRNPVLSLRVIAATQPVPGFVANLLAAMSQEHERALGNWQAELAQWPAVFIHTFSAVQALAELLGGLEIHLGRCRDNIDAMQGVIFAEGLSEVLTPALGKVEAQSLMTNLCQRAISERRSLGILVLELIETDLRCKSIDRLDVEKRFDVELAKVASARLLEEILDQTENDVSVETGF